MAIPRLTEKKVLAAIKRGREAGFWKLCSSGYIPEEVSIYTPSCVASDVRTLARRHAEKNGLPVPASCGLTKTKRKASSEPDDWRAAFRSTVMRTGLSLNLSQTQLEYLCAVADGVRWDRENERGYARASTGLVTEASLMKRGLIRSKEDRFSGRPTLEGAWCELTEAGRIVVDLLKEVGVFHEADAAIEKRVKGARARATGGE